MAEAPKPEQRKIEARIYTPSGWIVGTFHVPRREPFLRFLNAAQEFFTLTGVRLRGHSRPLPFLALQRSATMLVIPGEEPEADAADSTLRQVSCLLEGGVVMGSLGLPPSVRVSDHLMSRSSRFFLLRDCTVGLDTAGKDASVEALPYAVLSSARVVGVSEL